MSIQISNNTGYDPPVDEMNDFYSNCSRAIDILNSVDLSKEDSIKQTYTRAQPLIDAMKPVAQKWLGTSAQNYNNVLHSTLAAALHTFSKISLQTGVLKNLPQLTPYLQTLGNQLMQMANNTNELADIANIRFKSLSKVSSPEESIKEFVYRAVATFDNIIGMEEVKKNIKAFGSPLVRTFTRDKAKTILLHGPPGTGKTLYAESLANSLKATFLSITASNLYTNIFGESERKLSAIFDAMEQLSPAPVVCLIDEVEQLFPSRIGGGGHEANASLQIEFMTNVSGATRKLPSSIIMILNTNFKDKLDPAVLSRMSYKQYIGLPLNSDKQKLLRTFLSESDVTKISNRKDFYFYSFRDIDGLEGNLDDLQAQLIDRTRVFRYVQYNNSDQYQYALDKTVQKQSTGFTVVREDEMLDMANIPTYDFDSDIKPEPGQAYQLKYNDIINNANQILRPELEYFTEEQVNVTPINEQTMANYYPNDPQYRLYLSKKKSKSKSDTDSE